MAGNAHRRRHGNQPGCKFCQVSPRQQRRQGLHLYRNTNGHRRNPTRKRRGRRRRAKLS